MAPSTSTRMAISPPTSTTSGSHRLTAPTRSNPRLVLPGVLALETTREGVGDRGLRPFACPGVHPARRAMRWRMPSQIDHKERAGGPVAVDPAPSHGFGPCRVRRSRLRAASGHASSASTVKSAWRVATPCSNAPGTSRCWRLQPPASIASWTWCASRRTSTPTSTSGLKRSPGRRPRDCPRVCLPLPSRRSTWSCVPSHPTGISTRSTRWPSRSCAGPTWPTATSSTPPDISSRRRWPGVEPSAIVGCSRSPSASPTISTASSDLGDDPNPTGIRSSSRP